VKPIPEVNLNRRIFKLTDQSLIALLGHQGLDVIPGAHCMHGRVLVGHATVIHCS
jgi:hypothetical protein